MRRSRERWRVAPNVHLDVVSFWEAPCYNPKIVITTVSCAHDVLGWGSERLWPLWLYQTILVMFIGVGDEGFPHYVFAAAADLLQNIGQASPDVKHNDM